MEVTSSVSKGVFLYKQGVNNVTKSNKQKKTTRHKLHFENTLWYQSYQNLRNSIEEKINSIHTQLFSNILSSLIKYIDGCYAKVENEIPAATLLTGINMPDHIVQFQSLLYEIKKHVSPHVVILYSQDCQNIKCMVENMIGQFVNDNDVASTSNEIGSKLKKYQCTFSILKAWYEELYKTSPLKNKKRKILAVILPDFENFDPNVLQDLIIIMSSYLGSLPFVLIFGVATTVSALHRSLPYQVSSKINIQVFNSESSMSYLHSVVENIFFSEECPFHLCAKPFNLLSDIFLFYDFSVSGFIQGFKQSMIEHFSDKNYMALCCAPDCLDEILDSFDEEDFEDVRRLYSFRGFVENESPENRIKLLTNDEHLKDVLKVELPKFHDYLRQFHLILKCLHILVSDLPKLPLGKSLRELYATAVSSNISNTSGYQECFQLLNLTSKNELTNKVTDICNHIENNSHKNDTIVLRKKVHSIMSKLNMMNKSSFDIEDCEEAMEESNLNENKSRTELREKLLSLSKKSKPVSEYERTRTDLINYLSSFFGQYLIEPQKQPFWEIFFFNDTASIKYHVLGSHRAAIHTALNNPNHYMKCDCCVLPNNSAILQTLPDISIAYKLHLECGKMINLYDWFQAFLSIVDNTTAEGDHSVDPKIQARFTQAISELEFLGFIKNSGRKTDHVSRLTWGGC